MGGVALGLRREEGRFGRRALVAREPSDFWALEVPPASLFELEWTAPGGPFPARGRRCSIP